MATKAELSAQLTALRDTAVAAGRDAEATQLWQIMFMPNQTWAMVRVTPDRPEQWEIMYILGDTKGEALNHLRAMRQGLALGMTS